MIVFVKNWALPFAMLLGAAAYFVFSGVSYLSFAKPYILEFISFITPLLIFAQLLLVFCKVELKELFPKKWHLWLLLIQLFSTLIISLIILFGNLTYEYDIVFKSAIVCLLCPTATAAAVITAKLGGNASSLTTYTLISNIFVAIVVPLLFPLLEPKTNVTFIVAFFKILSKVFPLLLSPFILALLLKYFLPKVHAFLAKHNGFAFYIWVAALTIVTGQTVRSLVNSNASSGIEIEIIFVSLIICCFQFFMGKRIGSIYNDRISAGQALGQKNTVLAIWMAFTFLNPLTSVGPGSYVIWQNIINSYQLWKKRKKDSKGL